MLIEKLKLTIKELRHEQFGQSSERGALLDQLELQLADLEENAVQADTAAQMVAEKIAVPSFERRKPAGRSRSICRGSALSRHCDHDGKLLRTTPCITIQPCNLGIDYALAANMEASE